MAGESNGWPIKTIDEFAQVKSGKRLPKGHTLTESHTSYPYVRLVDIQNRRISPNEMKYLEEETQAKISRYIVNAGDVCLAIVGHTIGLVFHVDDEWDGANLTENAARVTQLDGVDSRFLFYYLTSENGQHEIRRRTVGSAQGKLPLYQIKAMPIPVPPLSKQKAIASILGALDAKIELNRRMNATLEAIARALFQSWFVDFDPVRAKLDGRQPAGMDSATAALFPDSFQDSSIGHIPKGWDVKPLGKVIELAYGKPLKSEDRKYGPVCVYGANGPVGWHNTKLVSGPGIIVGRKGNPGVVTWAQGDFYSIDTTFYVKPHDACRSLYFLYYALSLHNLANLSADSAVPGLNRNHVYLSEQIIPSQAILVSFDLQIAPIFSEIHANQNQSRTLANLRDTLLPKLLNGELSVAGVEKLVSSGIDASKHQPDEHAPNTTPGHGRQVSETRSVTSKVTKPSESTATAAPDIAELDTDEVMAAFRQALRGRGTITREELLKEVSLRLGYQRLGPTIRSHLKGHLRAAIRRQIVGTSGPDEVFAQTTTISDYAREDLIDRLSSVIPKNYSLTRADAITAVAQHLGFRRVNDNVATEIKSAINGAIRRGVLDYQGELIWRTS